MGLLMLINLICIWVMVSIILLHTMPIMFNTPTMLSWLLLPLPALFLIQVLLPTFVTREVFLWFCHEEPLSIAGRGTLVFDLQGQKIRVFNVLYVPDCTQNLLSILAVTTTGDKLVISHAVSYTHLDVYKRQLHIFVGILVPQA